MILGSYKLLPLAEDSNLMVMFREQGDQEEHFHPVTQGSFAGGYCHHPRLPYKSEDSFFFSEADDILVLLSGNIYNKFELSGRFENETILREPELVFRLFRREGPAFVKDLNGDFSIFILQSAKREAYLFRDHVGICPLAYTTDSNSISFSSDIIGLCRAISGGQVIESEYLMGYFRFVDLSKTPDIRVKKLLPGHYLCFSEKGVELTKYWDPSKIRTDKKLQYDLMLKDLRDIVSDAVRIRCDKRFTAGAHVSSGLDSGIVSVLARKEYSNQETFYGFSWSPADYTQADVKYDERKIVSLFCDKTNIKPLFSDLNESTFSEIISRFYKNQGYFSEDKASGQAVSVSTNLIFSGWGGDEFISTGDRGIDNDLLRKLRLREFFNRNPLNRPLHFIRAMRVYVVFPTLGILGKGLRRSFENDARYLLKPYRRSDRTAIRNFYFHTSRRQLHMRLLRFYHLQERCESWARLGYREGIEYRYPLLDKRIIEYMLKIPSELLCKTDHFRPLLREISEGILPDEVRWQWDKNDPVYWSWMNGLFKASALKFMEEVSAWRKNQNLHFVDFDLLEEDINKYITSKGEVNDKVLFRALVYLKAINDFTLEFRGKR